MGYLSWRTADDSQSLAEIGRGHDPRSVYLLQPGGKPPIEERAYVRGQVFGGVNAYAWLADHNLPTADLAPMSEKDKIDHGIRLNYGGHHLVDRVTGRRYTVCHPVPFLGMEHLADRWDTPVPQFEGKSANDLREEGRFETNVLNVKYPLKFSLNPKAVYENLPASSMMYVAEWERDDIYSRRS